jgi:hypothetical protein
MSLSRAAAFAVLAFASAGFAAEPPAGSAAPDGPGLVQVGPVTGDPEKDSVGLANGVRDECGPVPLFAREVVPHGPRTGDPEKDSVGLRVAGQ